MSREIAGHRLLSIAQRFERTSDEAGIELLRRFRLARAELAQIERELVIHIVSLDAEADLEKLARQRADMRGFLPPGRGLGLGN